MILTLPMDIMLAECRRKRRVSVPPGLTTQDGSIYSLANAHGQEAPQEAIDMPVIRDIDLMQGGEYVLLQMRCGKP
jgi:hypothetical protein